MQTALVAGGAGFIGTHLCQSLLNDNFRVICVDNFITSSKKNIEPLLNNQNFVFLEKDIIKTFEVDEPVDYVFHLASPASPNKNSPRSYINFPLETILANSQGTHNLLELSREKKSKFLFASTSEVYGDPLESPQNEEYFGNVNPNGIRSSYDESKRFGEAITMLYLRKYELDVRIIRIFNTYGPLMQEDDGRAVSEFVVSALSNKPLTIFGDGKQTRSFCFVDDLVSGIKLAMFKENTKGEVINLGNPDERSILDLAELVKKEASSSSEIVFSESLEDDPQNRKPDVSKAKKLLDWQPKITIEEGLLKTIAYFKSL